jgi:hypothetical protein
MPHLFSIIVGTQLVNERLLLLLQSRALVVERSLRVELGALQLGALALGLLDAR